MLITGSNKARDSVYIFDICGVRFFNIRCELIIC